MERLDDLVNCRICDTATPVADLIEFYDRHGIYSGRACSERCGKALPGQGEMRNYDYSGAGERLDEPD